MQNSSDVKNPNEPLPTSYASDARVSGVIREINLLLQEVSIVEQNCISAKAAEKQAHNLDGFQTYKVNLNNLLKTIKENIKMNSGLQDRTGLNTQTILLRNQIQTELIAARQLYTKMSEAYENDVKNSEKEKRGALTPAELEERKELLKLFKQDLDFTENEFNPKVYGGEGFQIAQQAQKRRKKQREQGVIPQTLIPLATQQQAFIDESIQRDQELGQKLDTILQGVKQLGMVAYDINEELDKQGVILNEVAIKMNRVQSKLETRNERLKQILQQSGGAERWLFILILIIILLALCGFIYVAVR